MQKKTSAENAASGQVTKTESDLLIKEKAIENSTSPIALIDLDGNLTYANPAFLTLWGYDTEDEVLGKTVTGF